MSSVSLQTYNSLTGIVYDSKLQASAINDKFLFRIETDHITYKELTDVTINVNDAKQLKNQLEEFISNNE